MTFDKDVAPIVFDHCATCHRPGQIGPFSLLSYQDVLKHADQIMDATADRVMPPWLPCQGPEVFKNARVLSDAQRQVFRAWMEQGEAEGNSRDLPPRPKFPEGWALGPPDVVLTMPRPFKVHAEGNDVYVHFVFPLHLDRDRYLRGIEVIPGNRRIAHHAACLLDTSGTARRRAAANDGFSYVSNDAGFVPAAMTPGYVPGQVAVPFPEGEAITFKKGSDFVLQMHYHPSGREETDQTRIGLYFTDKKPVRHGSIFLLGVLDVDIPAGDRAYTREDSFKLPVDYEIRNLWVHMHLIGKTCTVWADLPNGSRRDLLQIDRWDFNWQDTYFLRQPMLLPHGTVVHARFSWDNSAANPRNPFRPPQSITEGGQSTNEMAGVIVGGITPHQDQDWIHWLAVIGHYLSVDKHKKPLG